MSILKASPAQIGGRLCAAMDRFTRRHPWNHNDAFHPWIATRLPEQRGLAVDVGCGQGELLAVLAERFNHVLGIDIDAEMRQAALARCAGLSNVIVEAKALDDIPSGVDLVSMIAVLHHLELDSALEQVRRILSPGGRFLCVGLARPDSATDHVWETASAIANPIIGFIRHPWAAEQQHRTSPVPI